MKKLLIAASVAGLALAPVAASALTLNVGVGANVGASVGGTAGTSSGSASTGAGANVTANGAASGDASAVGGNSAAKTDFNVALGAFAGSRGEIDAINNLQDDSVVNVVRLDGMAGFSADALTGAESQNADAVAQLQAAINAKSDFKTQLEQNDIDVSSIVAADVAADGSLILYSASNG